MDFQRPAIRVLLIDDGDSDAAIIRRYLSKSESCTFVLDWAQSFDQGVKALSQSTFDLCLMDYRLGGHTGLDLLSREENLGARIPLIFLTGYGNLEVAVEAMSLGAIDYLDKSLLSSPLLERTILYAIENFRIRDALRRSNEQLEQRVLERTEELERRNLELERFAYVASHELQLPLKTITSHIEQMKSQASEEQADELSGFFLNRAHEGALRMQTIISRVLEYSRVGRKRSHIESVNLNDVVAELMLDFASLIAEQGAQIRCEQLPIVEGDPVLLRQLLGNLVGNALKYRGEAAPWISIRADLCHGEWLCVVEDNGLGIATDEQEKIFLMFHRASVPNTPVGEGIGLALCRRIVEHLGGRIWVESERGIGSHFYFTIPASNSIRDRFAMATDDGMPGQAEEVRT